MINNYSEEFAHFIFFTGVPAAVIIKDAVVEDGRITLKWDKPDENGAAITYYTIYRKTGSDEEWTKVKNLTDISKHAYVGKVEKGMTYKFVVTAGNKYGESGKDNIKEVEVPSGRLNVLSDDKCKCSRLRDLQLCQFQGHFRIT